MSTLQANRCSQHLQWIDSPQCESTARIEIDGKKYCHLHSGIIALEVFMDEKSEFELQPLTTRCECTANNAIYDANYRFELREAEGWRCRLTAKIDIDGISVCKQHARLMILQKWIKEGLAKQLPHCGTYNPMCIISQE